MFLMINAVDVFMIFFLIILEGVLSIDNALVLAATVKHLPEIQQNKALSFGIFGAFLFRFFALFFLNQLMHFNWVKIAGAVYLLWIGISHFLFPNIAEKEIKLSSTSFWKTILAVELLDMTFSMDSIFAASALSHDLTIIFMGGIIGIIMMRFIAKYFIKIMKNIPWVESLAYGLIIATGIKLGIEVL